MDESMTDAELDAALGKSYDDLLVLLNTKAGAILFHNAVQKDMKLNKLQNHWWTKLGRFLRVL